MLRTPSSVSKARLEREAEPRRAAPRINRYGGIVFDDADVVRAQRAALKQMALRVGKDVLTGKGINSVSFPVSSSLYMPQSQTEFLCESMSDAAGLLAPERFNAVVQYAFCCLYHSAQTGKKPFNPMIGETFSQFAQTGSMLLHMQAEHVLNHPATTLFKIKAYAPSPDHVNRLAFVIDGAAQIEGDLGLDKILISHRGLTRICFSGSQEVYCFTFPAYELNNLLQGERWARYLGEFTVAQLRGNPDLSVVQMIRGDLAALPIQKQVTLRFQDMPGRVHRLLFKTAETEVDYAAGGDFDGSWLSKVYDSKNDILYEAHELQVRHIGITENNVLSDGRRRRDVRLVGAGKSAEAYQEKLFLETRQRRERGLRPS